jgi:hypothetical protein
MGQNRDEFVEIGPHAPEDLLAAVADNGRGRQPRRDHIGSGRGAWQTHTVTLAGNGQAGTCTGTTPHGGETAARDYSIRRPLIAREITSCWISSVRAKTS